MGVNKGRNYSRSDDWCSQSGTNQKNCNRIRSHARKNYKRNLSSRTINSKLVESPLNPSLLPSNFVSSNGNHIPSDKEDLRGGLLITGIAILSLIALTMIIYCLIRFIRKRRESSKDEKDEVIEELPSPRELTLNFVKHNHPIPELCTTPDTQPILDYYSSKAGLTDALPPHIINSNKLNGTDNNHNRVKDTKEEHGYIPQYYNGMEIPPLGARIIPLERQVQIAKELTSVNLSPTNNNNNKRRSNRSISSILSIHSRRKSSASINNNSNNNNYNNNSSTTGTLALIHETPKNGNTANIDP